MKKLAAFKYQPYTTETAYKDKKTNSSVQKPFTSAKQGPIGAYPRASALIARKRSGASSSKLAPDDEEEIYHPGVPEGGIPDLQSSPVPSAGLPKHSDVFDENMHTQRRSLTDASTADFGAYGGNNSSILHHAHTPAPCHDEGPQKGGRSAELYMPPSGALTCERQPTYGQGLQNSEDDKLESFSYEMPSTGTLTCGRCQVPALRQWNDEYTGGLDDDNFADFDLLGHSEAMKRTSIPFEVGQVTLNPILAVASVTFSGPGNQDAGGDSKQDEDAYHHTHEKFYSGSAAAAGAVHQPVPEADEFGDAEFDDLMADYGATLEAVPAAEPALTLQVPGVEAEDYDACFDLDDTDLAELGIPSTILGGGPQGEYIQPSSDIGPSAGSNNSNSPPTQLPAGESFDKYYDGLDDDDFAGVDLFVATHPTQANQNYIEPKALRHSQVIVEEDQPPHDVLIAPTLLAVMEAQEPPSSVLPPVDEMSDIDIYDRDLQYSPVTGQESTPTKDGSVKSLEEPEDWRFMHNCSDRVPPENASCISTDLVISEKALRSAKQVTTEDEYSPLSPFARPPFRGKVSRRSPVTGISSTVVLRICFRIGEALSQAGICARDNQDAIFELFARVTSSARETEGHKQTFQLGDIFHGRPPFLAGVLENFAVSDLQKNESQELVTRDAQKKDESGGMVRVVGKVKRVVQGRGYVMEITNIRKTDWEEIRYTKLVLGSGN